MLVGAQVGVSLTRSFLSALPGSKCPVVQKGNIRGFILDEKSGKPEWATVQTPTEVLVSGVRKVDGALSLIR